MRYLHDQSIFLHFRGILPHHSLSVTLVCLLLLFSTGCGRLLRPFHHNPPPPPPNHPPTITLAANPAKVIAGSNDAIVLQAEASDPDNDPLNYKWSATGGGIDGSGPEVRWNSSGVKEGRYTVTVTADDGKGGTASASTNIAVEQKPNSPPVVSSCDANPRTISVGQKSTLYATASDADNDPLSYSYTTSGGHVAGSGANVQFDSTGTAPGTYTVSCHVSDGRGGEAQGNTTITVQATVEQRQLEQRLSLHSVYFPTGQPTITNPAGGLLPSQQHTLTTLAQDFKRYLAFKPDAYLILQGHTDPRGDPEYNKALSDRRVNQAKSYLISQGIDPNHIMTQGLGEETTPPMPIDQIKSAILGDSELSAAQKSLLTHDARALWFAQSNRVDITISTTGQTSVRQFPFGASDALQLAMPAEQLASDQAGESANPTPTPSPTPGVKAGSTCEGLALFVAPHTIDLAPVHRESSDFAAIVGRSPSDLVEAAQQLGLCSSPQDCERQLTKWCTAPTIVAAVGPKDVRVWHIPEITQCLKVKATLSGLGVDSIANQNGSDEKNVCPGSAKWNWTAQAKGDNHKITFWIGGKSGNNSDFNDLLHEIATYELDTKNAPVNWFVSLVNEILDLSLVKQIVLGAIGLGFFSWVGVRIKNVFRKLFQKEQPAPPVQQPAKAPPVVVVVQRHEPERQPTFRDRFRRRPTHRRDDQ